VDCATKKIKQVQIDIPTREAKQAGARIKPHYIEETVPEAFALGLVSSNRALVWVKDAGYDFVADNPSPYLDDVTLTVKGMADGAVNIEYWDNEKGIISSSAKEMVTGGKIELKLPRFTNDVGVKIYR
jgi:hypothetical protein